MKNYIKLDQKGTAITEVACVAVLLVVAGLASLGFVGSSVSQNFLDSGNKLRESSDRAAGSPKKAPDLQNNEPKGSAAGTLENKN